LKYQNVQVETFLNLTEIEAQKPIARVIDVCYPPSYFENYKMIEFKYERELGLGDVTKWSQEL
jgi:hypothetical protein